MGEIGRCLEVWAMGESSSPRTLNPAYDPLEVEATLPVLTYDKSL